MHSKRVIIIFLGIVLSVLVITNLVVFATIAQTFSLNSGTSRIWLWFALAILSLAFIGITILGRRYYNSVTRVITRVLSAYMGFFAYAFLAALVYGLMIMIGWGSHPLGLGLFLLVVLVSLYGLWHARRIQISRVTVPLPSREWQSRRAVFVSDLHLGQVLGPTFARSIAERIMALRPDLILIGGDLFDGTAAPDLPKLIAPLRALSAPQGVFFVTGNHEEFGDSSPFLRAIENLGITILRDDYRVIDGLQLVGVDDTTCEHREDFARILAGLGLDRTKPAILLRHQPKDLDVAAASGITLQLSGHTHRAQQWPFEYLAQWAFRGYAYGLKKYGAMAVYTSSGVGTWGPPLRVGTNAEIVEVSFGGTIGRNAFK